MTNAALARLLGENEMWVSRRVRDRSPITIDDLQRIAVALELPVSFFLDDSTASRP